PALAALAAALLRILQATNLLTASLALVQGNIPALARLLRLTTTAIPQDYEVPAPVTFARDIRLQNVRVSYDRGHTALDDIVLTIGKGEKLAIVGRSGSGKSTLLDVLLGLTPPDAGDLLIDGVSIAGDAGRVAGWRQQIAAVAQDLYVPDLSIARLIGGEGPKDDARLQTCLADVGLAVWVEQLPEGVDTRLGSAGLLVSGGQRQRLGIARALYRNAALIVLDEATAQLDLATEAALLKRLLELCRARTVIFVTHREQSLVGFDRLIRLEKGRIEQDISLVGSPL
ncbi:MAG: ABC transporter ATP-binding protein, partial [Sphingomonas sp.]